VACTLTRLTLKAPSSTLTFKRKSSCVNPKAMPTAPLASYAYLKASTASNKPPVSSITSKAPASPPLA
jgi:hypothetical protein